MARATSTPMARAKRFAPRELGTRIEYEFGASTLVVCVDMAARIARGAHRMLITPSRVEVFVS
ncbi:MAG: hypothetical protein ABIT83_12635 [Massilia sp.]